MVSSRFNKDYHNECHSRISHSISNRICCLCIQDPCRIHIDPNRHKVGCKWFCILFYMREYYLILREWVDSTYDMFDRFHSKTGAHHKHKLNIRCYFCMTVFPCIPGLFRTTRLLFFCFLFNGTFIHFGHLNSIRLN